MIMQLMLLLQETKVELEALILQETKLVLERHPQTLSMVCTEGLRLMVVLQDAVNEMSAYKSRELSCSSEHTISSIVIVLPADLPVILFTEKPLYCLSTHLQNDLHCYYTHCNASPPHFPPSTPSPFTSPLL